MPDPRAHFRFEMDKDISIDNKRALAKLASRHIYDSMTFSNRSLDFVESSLIWLRRLKDHEDRLMDLKVLEDKDEVAAEDRRLRDQAYGALIEARRLILAIRNRRVGVATQMEEDFDPIFKSARAKPKRIHPKARAPETLAAPTQTPAQIDLREPISTPPAAPSPPPIQRPPLKLDPRLIARARGEISRRAKEDAGNGLSAPSIGTDTDGN